MNREILFRAKSIQTNRWIYGYYFKDEDNKSYIGYMSKERYIPDIRDWDIVEYYENNPTYNWVFVKEEVVSETVGQYTGLTDIHGDKIFEGDIITNISDGSCGYVEWNNNCAGFIIVKDNNKHCTLSASEEYEIVANIYYHPMML